MSNIIPLIDLFVLLNQCAPDVHPRTMAAIVETESSRNIVAININGEKQLERKPETIQEAIEIVKQLQENGANFDAGLAQINSGNFASYGLDAENIFDPCTNIKAGSSILKDNYQRASENIAEEQEALLAALSAYNTGNYKHGLENGYVEKVKKKASLLIVPEILPDSDETTLANSNSSTKENQKEWNVFSSSRIDHSVMVFKQ